MTTRRWLVLLVPLLAAGCSEALPGPLLRSINPNKGAVGQELRDVAIEGARFFVRVRSNFDDPAHTAPNTTFLARLVTAGGESHSLADVIYASESKLTVTVPGTLAVGFYTLEVVDPWGRKGTLPEAFTVGDTRSDLGVDARSDLGVDTNSDLGVDAPTDQGVDTPADQGVDVPADATLPIDLSPPDLLADSTTGDFGPPSGTVEPLASDPFGDGSTFAFVFAYRGLIYLGPQANGGGAVRMQPDGSQSTKVTFSLPADSSGNSSDNSALPPYSSLGATGCTKDTLACGPDNENGRGLFTSGTMGGQPWLIAAGAKASKDFDYVYMTSDSDTQLDFRYVDLNQQLGGGATTVSALRVFGDRAYLAVSDEGGAKPYLVVLTTTPPAPGFDAAKPADAESLAADKMPGIGGQRAIDSFGELNGRLYLFNPGGCIRSTTTQPRSYNGFPADWAVCTPSAGAYLAKTSLPATKLVDIEPNDKAVPYLATFKGRLYAARHTTTGPQLWGCNPLANGDPLQCDPGDWSLIAGNSLGDLDLTQFDNGNNTAITLLAATANHLYVGFENGTDGVVLFRSSAAAPTTRADFTGLAGCSAAQTSCPGLGGNGLGVVPKMTRILDGVAATFGARDYVYLVVNDGTNAVRLLRVAD